MTAKEAIEMLNHPGELSREERQQIAKLIGEFNSRFATSTGAVKSHAEFIERVRSMTPGERFAALVSAGINNPDGTLTERYRD